MNNLLPHRIVAALAGLATLPAFGHVTDAATPHLHDGDGWGLLVVVALTAAFAWLVRRR